jgi:tetratricopeptide (TPR) repeat protein
MPSPAAEALDLAFADPHRALALARGAARSASRRGDLLELSMAQQAVGLALRCLQRPKDAVRALQRSVATASRGGLVEQRGRAQLGLALALGFAGHSDRALATLDTAARTATGLELARVQVQRGNVLHLLGQPAAAAAAVSAALPVLRRGKDTLWGARARMTLGLAQVELARFGEADENFAAAERLFADLGQHADSAGSRHNRGWCAALLGDVPTALAHYEDAERRFAALGIDVPDLLLDRARLLLSAGLAAQAGSLIGELLGRLGSTHPVAHADALLALSQAALAGGDLAGALDAARRADDVLRDQRRPGRTALARHTAVQARWLAGDRGPALLELAVDTADRLEREGHAGSAAETRLVAGRIALGLGDDRLGLTCLRAVAAGRGRGTPRQRSLGWLAAALLLVETGDRAGAARALQAGVAVLDGYRASLGATELRAHLAVHAADLIRTGRRLALRSGHPARVLRWIELGQASALRLPKVRPPADPELAAALATLRRLAQVDRPSAAVRREQARLRDRVRQLTLRAAGSDGPDRSRVPTVRQLADALGDRVLVSVADVDDTLVAVSIRDGRARLHELPPAAEVRAAAAALLRCLRRVVAPGRPAALAGSARAALAAAVAHFEGLFLAPLRRVVEGRELVLTPPVDLCALPWAALPALGGRALTVAPSVSAWRATQAPVRATRAVLVAGPDLAHADAEISRIAALYPAVDVFGSTAAPVDAVLAALDGADVAHIASHCEVVPDNPLFSALRLTDGPLMAYDMERLRQPPAVVVLSACNSAASSTAGDEMLGLAVALLSSGTATVLGCVAPLSDGGAPGFVVEVHRRLAAGLAPRYALAEALGVAAAGDAVHRVVGESFVALGAG